MGRNNSPNISFYHYRVDFYDEEMERIKASKHYFTVKAMEEEFHTSKFTLQRLLNNPGRKVNNPGLKNVKIYRDKQPVFTRRRNENIYGELDEIEDYI